MNTSNETNYQKPKPGKRGFCTGKTINGRFRLFPSPVPVEELPFTDQLTNRLYADDGSGHHTGD